MKLVDNFFIIRVMNGDKYRLSNIALTMNPKEYSHAHQETGRYQIV